MRDTMLHKGSCWGIALVLWATTAGGAEISGPTSRDMQSLTAAVNRLATILEAQEANGTQPSLEKLNLAISYLNFRSRRIEQLERDLASSRSNRTNLEGNLKLLTDRMRDLDERQRQNGPTSLSNEESRENELMKTQLGYIKERIGRLDDEILQQENRIYDLQKEIASVESYVRKYLAF